MKKTYTKKQIVEAITHWKKQLNESDYVQSQTRYVQTEGRDLTVQDLVKVLQLAQKTGNSQSQVCGLVVADETNMNAQDNYIGGFVNSSDVEDGKCILTLSPYISGRRRQDLSVNSSAPFKADQLLSQVRSIDGSAAVFVKMKDPVGMGPNVGRIVEAPVFAGKVTSNAYNGVFLCMAVERSVPVDATVKLDEVQHDGTHVPRHPTRRNETDKPTVYYVGIDQYSDNFSEYGQYVTPSGGLTQDASSESFKSAAVTKVPASLKAMAEKAVAKYGKDHYIFVFKEEYSYGNQTHKRHARPAVIDIWYPDGQYWKYGFQPVEALSESCTLNESYRKEIGIASPSEYGAPYPPFNPKKINEKAFDEELRSKWAIAYIEDGNGYVEWESQEEPYHSEEWETEVKRAFIKNGLDVGATIYCKFGSRDTGYIEEFELKIDLEDVKDANRYQQLTEADIDVPDSKISTSMDLVVETPGDNGVNIHIQTDEDGLDTVREIISILKQGISTHFPKKVAGMEFVHFYAQ